MLNVKKIFITALGLLLMSGLSLAEETSRISPVNLVCDFDYAELGAQTGVPRLKNAIAKPTPAHFALRIADDSPGPFGKPWLINDAQYFTDQTGENDHALSINRLDGSATYLSIYSAKEGHFKILYPGKCKKLEQPLL
jgi:hypothetical protein